MDEKLSKEAALKIADALIAVEKSHSSIHTLTSIASSLQYLKPVQRAGIHHEFSDFKHSTNSSSYVDRDSPGSAFYWANRTTT